MSAIPATRRLAAKSSFAVHDVEARIKSWGTRGMLSGFFGGLIAGTIIVTHAWPNDDLAFGIAGTLLVCAIECAVIAGGAGVVTAVLHGGGARRSDASQSKRPSLRLFP